MIPKFQKGGVLFKKTSLPAAEEKKFLNWSNGEDPEDYDLRGFYVREKKDKVLKPSIGAYLQDPDFHFYSIGLNGKILKSDKHPTRGMTMMAEEMLGNKVRLTDEGLVSLPRLQQGGPIYVTDPNDPRLRAYRDSLGLHNAQERYNKEAAHILSTSKTDNEYATRMGYDEEKSGVLKEARDEANSIWRRHPDWKEESNVDPGIIRMPDGIHKRRMEHVLQFKKPTQEVRLRKLRKKESVNKLPSLTLKQLESERPIVAPKAPNPLHEDGEFTAPWKNVPNLSVVFRKNKGKSDFTPYAIENTMGKRILYKDYKDKKLPRGFQHPNKFQQGGTPGDFLMGDNPFLGSLNQGDLANLFMQMQGLMQSGDATRLNPGQNDINPFRVNPTRGHLGYQAGGNVGYNFPSLNLIAPLDLRMLPEYKRGGLLTALFQSGGRTARQARRRERFETRLERSGGRNEEKRREQFEKKGKFGFFGGLEMLGDQTLSFLGMPDVIQNSFYDEGVPDWFKGVNSTLGKVGTSLLSSAIPGVGIGLKALQGLGGGQGQGSAGAGMNFPGFDPMQQQATPQESMYAKLQNPFDISGMGIPLIGGYKKGGKISKADQAKVSKKIAILMKEGNMKSDQAAAIAFSMLRSGKLQQGGEINPLDFHERIAGITQKVDSFADSIAGSPNHERISEGILNKDKWDVRYALDLLGYKGSMNKRWTDYMKDHNIQTSNKHFEYLTNVPDEAVTHLAAKYTTELPEPAPPRYTVDQNLRTLGYRTKGTSYKKALETFQVRNGLPVTGKVDSNTTKALDREHGNWFFNQTSPISDFERMGRRWEDMNKDYEHGGPAGELVLQSNEWDYKKNGKKYFKSKSGSDSWTELFGSELQKAADLFTEQSNMGSVSDSIELPEVEIVAPLPEQPSVYDEFSSKIAPMMLEKFVFNQMQSQGNQNQYTQGSAQPPQAYFSAPPFSNSGNQIPLIGRRGGFAFPMGGLIPYGPQMSSNTMANQMSQLGYSQGSPYANMPQIPIQGNQIDMSRTNIPLQLIPNVGRPRVAMPNSGQYSFPGATSVLERRFQMGGMVGGIVPIQTEKGEAIIHLDGTITKSNAVKKHSQMDDEDITDLVPQGTYIASNDPKLKVSRKESEDIFMGIKAQPYEESKQGMIPKEIYFSDLFGKKSKLTIADLAFKIKNKYSTIDREDPFTEITNRVNIESRTPWIKALIAFNEEKKNGTYQYGGPVQFQGGGGLKLEDLLGIAGSAIPWISSLFGGQNQSNVDPITRNMLLGSVPLHTLGLSQNIRSQQGALGQGIDDFTALGKDLEGLAYGQAGSNIAGTLLQETQLPRYDFQSQRSRLQGFNTQAPRSFVNALSTPQYDMRGLAQELGPRGFSSFSNNLVSNQLGTRNQAISNQFNQDRGLDFQRMGMLNQVDMAEQQGNIPIQMQEIQNRNLQRQGVFGNISGLMGNIGNIRSQILPITTQFNLQRAGLDGQIAMGTAQNMQNVASIYGTFNQLGQGSSDGGMDWLRKLLEQNGNVGGTYEDSDLNPPYGAGTGWMDETCPCQSWDANGKCRC